MNEQKTEEHKIMNVLMFKKAGADAMNGHNTDTIIVTARTFRGQQQCQRGGRGYYF